MNTMNLCWEVALHGIGNTLSIWQNWELMHMILSDLELPFIEEEVWRTIKQLPSDKASGLDQYTCHFYKVCWAIIQEDIVRM